MGRTDPDLRGYGTGEGVTEVHEGNEGVLARNEASMEFGLFAPFLPHKCGVPDTSECRT